MYIVIKCKYCQNKLTANDITVACNFCRHNPCYVNGQEESVVFFDAIPVDSEIYTLMYNFETMETEVRWLKTIDSEGYIKYVPLTKLIAPFAITPDNIEDFVRRCAKMKAFV